MAKDRSHSVRKHPLFGQIPMVPHPEYEGVVRFDPDYEPPMPAGAVRGDIRRQDYCPMCHVPRYFYVDEPRVCVQCSQPFTFGAAEQKFWYETLRFWADSTAIRCVDCRRKQRGRAAIQRQLDAALKAVRQSPDDPARLIELAEARALYREQWGEGDVDGGIAAARRAQALWPEQTRGLFWEGRLQALAGRPAKARTCFRRFVEQTTESRGLKPLLRYAEQWLMDD